MSRLLQRTKESLIENSKNYEIIPKNTQNNPMEHVDIELESINNVRPNYRYSRGDSEYEPHFHNHTSNEVNGNVDDYKDRKKRVHSKHRNDQVYPENSQVYMAYEAKTGPRKKKTDNVERHANDIVAKMKKDENLMKDTPHSQKLQRETLRDMPQCLTVKRCVKRKLSMVKHKKRSIDCCTSLKSKISSELNKVKNDFKSIISSLELWYGPLKEIEGRFGSGVGSFFKFLRWIFIFDIILAIPVILFIVIPQLAYNEPVKNNATFRFSDIFTGEGYFVKTALYYGFYSNDSVNLSDVDYNMPKAYFFTNMSIYLVALIVLCSSAANKYNKSFIETAVLKGGVHNVFAQKIFCSWDFGIANRDAADLKSNSIYNELRELLYDVEKTEHQKSCLEKFRTIMLQLTSNVIVLFLFTGIGYLVWFFMSNHSAIVCAIVVNLILLFVPYFLSYLVLYEGYELRTNLYITLFRQFLLGFIVISVMVTFWLERSQTDLDWESSLGQEIYRLFLFDFIFAVVLSFVFDVCMFFGKRALKKDGRFEFNIPRHTMHIIYSQSLLWLGLFYAPLISVMMLMKLFAMWYINLATVKLFCRPPRRSWRGARTQTWFTIMVAARLLFVVCVQGYVIFRVSPSKKSGPFQNYNYFYEVITGGLFNLEDSSIFFKIIIFIMKPGCISLMLIGLSILVYLFKKRAESQRESVDKYREMLKWETKDKEFLVRKINQLTQGDWHWNLQDSRAHDPINMLPRYSIRRQDSQDYREFEPSTSQGLIE